MLFFVSYSISFCFCSYLNYFLSWVFIVFYLNPRVEVNTRDLFLSVLIGNRWALSLYNPMPHFSYIPQVWNNNFCIVSRLELQIPNLGIWIFLLQLLTLKNFKPTDNWKEWHNQYLYVIHLDFPVVNILPHLQLFLSLPPPSLFILLSFCWSHLKVSCRHDTSLLNMLALKLDRMFPT